MPLTSIEMHGLAANSFKPKPPNPEVHMDLKETRSAAKQKVKAFVSLFSTDEVQVNHMVLAPGEEVPWHFHSHVRDTLYVLRGPVTIFTREPAATLTVGTGETVETPARQPHRVVNASDHDVSMLLIQGVGTYDFQFLPPPK
jgi:quercetin dioxygenase-like cupin family protein